MLFCMAFVTAYPLFPSFRYIYPNWHTTFYSLRVLCAALGALIATWRKTHSYLKWRSVGEQIKSETGRMERLWIWFEANLIFFQHRCDARSAFSPSLYWVFTCQRQHKRRPYYVGWFFSYRCLHTRVAACLLLFLCSSFYSVVCLGGPAGVTVALFGKNSASTSHSPWRGKVKSPLFVSDEAIYRPGRAPNNSLTSNITCLLITREVAQTILPPGKMVADTLPHWGLHRFVLCFDLRAQGRKC